MRHFGYPKKIYNLVLRHPCPYFVKLIFRQHLLPLYNDIIFIEVDEVSVASTRSTWVMQYLQIGGPIFSFRCSHFRYEKPSIFSDEFTARRIPGATSQRQDADEGYPKTFHRQTLDRKKATPKGGFDLLQF